MYNLLKDEQNLMEEVLLQNTPFRIGAELCAFKYNMSALLSRLKGADKRFVHMCVAVLFFFFKCANPVSIQTRVHLIHGIILDWCSVPPRH